MEPQIKILPGESQQEEASTKTDLLRWVSEGESLEYADFSGSNLVGLSLPKLNFRGASFQDADLRYANLAGVILEGANLQGANLASVSFRGANLINANLEGAILDNADFLKANLKNACLKNAALTHTSFRGADITEVDFTNADLRWVNFAGVRGSLEGIKFDNADLQGARGDYARLDEHELKDVGAKVDGAMAARGFYKRVFDFFDIAPPTLKEHFMYMFRIFPKKK